MDTPRLRGLDETLALLRSKLLHKVGLATDLGKKDLASSSLPSFTLVEKSEHDTVRHEIAEGRILLEKLSHERAAATVVLKGKTSI